MQNQGHITCASNEGCVEVSLSSVSIGRESDGIRANYSVIQVQGSVLSVFNCTFSECFSSADGSCVQSYDQALVNITWSTFRKSSSSGYGGAISSAGSEVYLNHCAFYNCHSDLGGGALWASTFYLFGSNTNVDTSVYIDSTAFESCTSLENGGGILVSDSSDSQENINIWIRTTTFDQCSSAGNGGAFSVSGVTVSAKIFNSTFTECISSENGGAIFLENNVLLILIDSRFDANFAYGLGGGAIGSSDSFINLMNIDSSENLAPYGGGGLILIEGFSMIITSENEVAYNKTRIYSIGFEDQDFTVKADTYIAEVFEIVEAVGVNSSICAKGIENYAAYGPCIASTYHRLEVEGLPAQEDPVSPGIPFYITAIKKDIFNQTILSDSSSILQMLTSIGKTLQNDPAVSISGEFVSVLQNGSAEFTIMLEPSFSKISFLNEQTVLLRKPYVYLKGIDANSISTTMETHPFEIFIASGKLVCPPGYILVLDKSRKGSCSECSVGTYSVNPLAGDSLTQPSCFQCPLNGVCNGGDSVQLPLGIWIITSGFYKLIACPEAFQLIDSNSLGIFSRDSQTCHPCSSTQYIINSNLSNITCQPCPKGDVKTPNIIAYCKN